MGIDDYCIFSAGGGGGGWWQVQAGVGWVVGSIFQTEGCI